MAGLDAQGNSGLRDKVDNHYKRLFGFAVLTSMFDAALAVTQSRQQSVLLSPSPTQESESAAGRKRYNLFTKVYMESGTGGDITQLLAAVRLGEANATAK